MTAIELNAQFMGYDKPVTVPPVTITVPEPDGSGGRPCWASSAASDRRFAMLVSARAGASAALPSELTY